MPLTRPSCAGPIPISPSPGRPSARLGVPAQRIHTERFVSLAENPFEAPGTPAGGVAATLDVTLDGERRVLPWPAGTRMLDVLLDEGLDAPFSCRQGICGACACQLTSERQAGPAPDLSQLMAACDTVLKAQQSRVAIPRRFAVPMRELLMLQPRFSRRSGVKSLSLLQHPRFRAAFDFLLLRAQVGVADPELARWWTDIQVLPQEQRVALVQARPAEPAVEGGGTGRRRRRRRRGGAARS